MRTSCCNDDNDESHSCNDEENVKRTYSQEIDETDSGQSS